MPWYLARVLERIPPDEQVVLATRPHWARLLPPLLLVAGVVGLVAGPMSSLRVPWWTGPTVICVGLLITLHRIADWWRQLLLVTSRRVQLTSGVLRRRKVLQPLPRVADLTWKQSPVGRLLGYATIRFEPTSHERAVLAVEFVPDGTRVYATGNTLLFGQSWRDGGLGDDEGNVEPPAHAPTIREIVATNNVTRRQAQG